MFKNDDERRGLLELLGVQLMVLKSTIARLSDANQRKMMPDFNKAVRKYEVMVAALEKRTTPSSASLHDRLSRFTPN